MRAHLLRGFRFGVTGIANTGIHVVVAYLCLAAGPVAANAVAFIVATLFSYVVNTLWSFSTAMTRQNLSRFIVVAIIGLLAAVLLAKVGELIGLPPMGSVWLVVCVMPFVNFGLHSLWTYR